MGALRVEQACLYPTTPCKGGCCTLAPLSRMVGLAPHPSSCPCCPPAPSPIAMYNKVHSPPRWKRVVLAVVNGITFVVSVLAVVGSAMNIAQDAANYRMFGGRR